MFKIELKEVKKSKRLWER